MMAPIKLQLDDTPSAFKLRLDAQGMPPGGPRRECGSGASAPASPVAKPCAHNDNAYTLDQRQAHAEQAILFAASGLWLDQTSCWHICRTYGVPHLLADLKALRAKFRNELSFGEGK